MKLIYKVILISFFIPAAWAQKIIITYHNDSDRRDMVYEVLTEKLGLPESFITTIETSNPCLRRPEVVLQICIEDSGKIYFPVARRDILRKSFKVFLKDRE